VGRGVIALAVALTALCSVTLGALVAALLWYRATAANLNDVRETAAALLVQRNEARAGEAAAAHQLEMERDLRKGVEAQRDKAQIKVRELFAAHMRTATDDDIRALTADAFGSPLGLVPIVPPRSESGADRLIDPFGDVQPAATPKPVLP
jgi:hypothetical protein